MFLSEQIPDSRREHDVARGFIRCHRCVASGIAMRSVTVDAKQFVVKLQADLQQCARKADEGYPGNDAPLLGRWFCVVPERYQMPVTLNPTQRDDRRAEKFITEAGKQSASANKKPLLVRFDAETMERIAQAAKRLNISRSAFVASSTVREPERMEA